MYDTRIPPSKYPESDSDNKREMIDNNVDITNNLPIIENLLFITKLTDKSVEIKIDKWAGSLNTEDCLIEEIYFPSLTKKSILNDRPIAFVMNSVKVTIDIKTKVKEIADEIDFRLLFEVKEAGIKKQPKE